MKRKGSVYFTAKMAAVKVKRLGRKEVNITKR